MDDVMNEITSRATMVTRADGVYVERIIGSDMQVEVVAAYGRGTPARGTRVDYPGSLTEEVLRGRSPVIIADMKGVGASMAPYLTQRCSDCELLVSPLVADEEPLGALVLLNSRASGRQFHPADINRARTLGDLASLALRRVRLMEQEREARAAAEVALRVRDETLGIVSHDLRNPLTTIALSAELFDGASEEESREHVRTIRNAARQMERLIQDLLDVARVEAGRLSVQKSRIDVAAVARQACDAQLPIAEARGIMLVVEIPDLPEVDADRDRIVQVFGNLIGNALKFTPAGGTISVRGCEKKGSVMFDVRDTGPGLPDSDLKNVFKPYWQAKKTAHMGAGLGLAIVRGIIEAHGGTVSAANAAGGGALFAFTIPCATLR
jgi:signal transduction histidine kinase